MDAPILAPFGIHFIPSVFVCLLKFSLLNRILTFLMALIYCRLSELFTSYFMFIYLLFFLKSGVLGNPYYSFYVLFKIFRSCLN